LYVAHIQYRDFSLLKSFNNEADADNYICEINERENLPIKNKFVVFNGWAEVELAGGVTSICDPQINIKPTNLLCLMAGQRLSWLGVLRLSATPK